MIFCFPKKTLEYFSKNSRRISIISFNQTFISVKSYIRNPKSKILFPSAPSKMPLPTEAISSLPVGRPHTPLGSRQHQ